MPKHYYIWITAERVDNGEWKCVFSAEDEEGEDVQAEIFYTPCINNVGTLQDKYLGTVVDLLTLNQIKRKIREISI